MEDAIKKAVKVLAEKITPDVTAEDAVRYTQAALNLQNLLAVKSNVELQKGGRP